MKNLLTISPAKIYLACGFSLFMTLGAFWHHQMNQTQLDRMGILNQGIGTCFNRISQTFTALMIKDVQSPYLNREFMGLSDECLNETIKGINPFKKNVGKGYETLNQLISEVHWFHETVAKIHGPMLAKHQNQPSLSPLSDRYGKMEMYKMDLVDEIDAASMKIRGIQINDEYLMGSALILFVVALSLLSLQEFNKVQVQRELEKEALNFLKTGKANPAIVDQLIDRALNNVGLPVTAQIFRDYHGNILERLAARVPGHTELKATELDRKVPAPEAEGVYTGHKTSLKEVLVHIQNVLPPETIQLSDVRDVLLNVPFESFEQMINSAIHQLASRRGGTKKILVSNQIHSDKSVINLFLSGSTFNVSELEFAYGHQQNVSSDIDMNLVILKEMVNESGAHWHLENKVDRQGVITGMNIRFTLPRAPKEKSKLISVFKGKKKDLNRELVN